MKIREFYYDEDCKSINVEFSSKEDEDDYYRIIEMTNDDVIFYSPVFLEESDIETLSHLDVIEIINEYLLENDLPEQLYL